MTPSPTLQDLAGQPDPKLVAAMDAAREAAEQDAAAVAPGDSVGAHVGVQAEGGAATHLFEARYPGYRGWRWAVTVATAGPDAPVTVSEVVLLPGPDALVAPEWVPWDQRVRAGDLGVGDLLPTAPDDPRLVPGYLRSDDPAVEDVARELGLGRRRVLSREGRLDAAQRWLDERGPSSDMAGSAPGTCATCGFYLPIAGSLGAAFGACGNEFAPADGRVVHAEFGCGAHSEVEVEPTPLAPIAEVVYDDAQLDLVPAPPQQAQDPQPGLAAEGPVSEGSATEGSAAEGSATEGSATEGSAAEGSVAGGPVADESAVEGSVAEASAVEASAVEGSLARGSVAEGSAAGGSAVDGPGPEPSVAAENADSAG